MQIQQYFTDNCHLSELQDPFSPKKYVYIMLLKYPDRFSRTFRFFSRCKYSHVSIGLSGTDWTFFSYVLKGFRTEFPKRYPTFKSHEVPCKLYRIEVTDEVYANTKQAIDEHVKLSDGFRFSYLNVALTFMHIVSPLKDQYICSQFVSEMLQAGDVVPLKKHNKLYLPDDFIGMPELELVYEGVLSELVNPAEIVRLAIV